MNKIIKSGYYFEAVSWENDGDEYKTISRTGLSKEEAKFLVELSEILQNEKTGLENVIGPDTEQCYHGLRILAEVFKKYPDVCPLSGMEIKAFDTIRDYVIDNILGESEFFYFRVLQRYSVYFVPKTIELKDVSEDLIKFELK